MVFVEGIIQSLKHMSSMSVPISPVALLLGDYNHIFAIQKVGGSGTISSQTLRDFHEKENYWAKELPDWTEEWDKDFDGLEWDFSQKAMDAYMEGCGFNLKFALGNHENIRSIITGFIFNGIFQDGETLNILSLFSTTQAPVAPVKPSEKESEKSTDTDDEDDKIPTASCTYINVLSLCHLYPFTVYLKNSKENFQKIPFLHFLLTTLQLREMN